MNQQIVFKKATRPPISWAGEIPIDLNPPQRRKGPRLTPVEKRFWPKVRKTKTCWRWTGSKNNTGYGRININARGVVFAHRVSWVLAHGNLPPNFCVLHRCDMPSCVRPDHLFLGRQADNSLDMRKKGRMFSKLSKDSVVEILKAAPTRKRGFLRVMATKYGVTVHAIWRVVHRKTWRCVGQPL